MSTDDAARFFVQMPDGRHSAVWRLWTDKSEVYLAARSMAGAFKLSLHTNENSRLALTKEYDEKLVALGKKPAEEDRVLFKWKRPVAPAVDGLLVIRITCPTPYLTAKPLTEKETSNALPFQPEQGYNALDFDIVFTSEAEATFLPKLQTMCNPIGNFSLPNGEFVYLAYNNSNFDTHAFETQMKAKPINHAKNIAANDMGLDDASAGFFYTDPEENPNKSVQILDVHGLSIKSATK